MVTQEKSVYYADKTSHLMAMLLEYLAVLDLSEDYQSITDFLENIGVDLALFIPHQDSVLERIDDIPVKNHELALFSYELYREGYQSEVRYNHDFDSFKKITINKKESDYYYRTEACGYSWLLGIAHLHFRTPCFPNKWRPLIN